MAKFITCVALVLVGCAPEKPEIKNRNHDDSAAVVEVGKEAITLREYERRIQEYPKVASQNFQTVDQKRANLEYVAQFETLAQYGIENGYGTDPRALLAAQTQIVEEAERGKFEPTSVEVATELKRRVAAETDPEQRRVSRFESGSREFCDELVKTVSAERDVAAKFDAFGKFSAGVGEHDSNLGLTTADKLREMGLDDAIAAKVGDVGVVGDAPCVVWLVSGIVPAQAPDVAEVERAVIAELRDKRRAAHRQAN